MVPSIPAVDYWGPYSVYWDKNDLTLSQNMGQMYIGALPIVLVMTVGITRGVLWTREMRAYTLSIAFLVALRARAPTRRFSACSLKSLPGVAMFRRPADASFLVGGLLAIAGGYVCASVVDRQPARAQPAAAELSSSALIVALVL